MTKIKTILYAAIAVVFFESIFSYIAYPSANGVVFDLGQSLTVFLLVICASIWITKWPKQLVKPLALILVVAMLSAIIADELGRRGIVDITLPIWSWGILFALSAAYLIYSGVAHFQEK
jgi:hypothetical protein